MDKKAFEVGDAVKHVDGSIGRVTEAADKFGVVHWKSCGVFRFSDKSALEPFDPAMLRWRAAKGE